MFSGGAAGAVSLNVAAQPADGDVVRVTLGLRDGTRTTIELTARRTPDPNSTTEFAIGANPAETAANLTGRLGAAIDREARTTLSAASAQVAAGDFFAGATTPGREPRRIAGSPPFDAATGFSSTAGGRTVIWYTGDDSAPSARDTALVRIDKGQSVSVGAQANEAGFRGLLSQLAVLASSTFSADATDRRRYGAMTERVRTALTPAEGAQTLDRIGIDLGQASATMGTAKERHAGTRALLQDALGGIESASPEEVGAQILQLQTRLQASYATTSLLSKLSLVNYLS
jgi:flagellin-like hook-associated protein FlgL